jgi:hypothetical protein
LDLIGAYAFCECSGLTQINLPDGLTRLGISVFADCVSLTSIALPAQLDFLGVCAFTGCSSLKTIVVPAKVQCIGWDTFAECVTLQTVLLPAALVSIQYRAFRGCQNLKSLILPAGLGKTVDVADDAFRRCARLDTMVVLDDSDTVLNRFGGKFSKYACRADLPLSAQGMPGVRSAAGVHLWQRWSLPGAAFRHVSAHRRALEWVVFLVGNRLDTETGGLPPEVWALVLGFVRHKFPATRKHYIGE